VGQGDREEVDTPIVSGGNYGWRVWEGFFCTNNDPSPCGSPGFIAPLFEYGHVNGRCSITGGYVYRGAQGAVADGTYVYGDFCSGEILGWDGSETGLLDTSLNISSFGEEEAGEIYVVGLGGSVSRLAATTLPPTCTFSISPARQSFSNAGGPGSVAVSAPAGCAWSATEAETWITITGGASGNGNGTVEYSVAPYSGRQGVRNGRLKEVHHGTGGPGATAGGGVGQVIHGTPLEDHVLGSVRGQDGHRELEQRPQVLNGWLVTLGQPDVIGQRFERFGFIEILRPPFQESGDQRALAGTVRSGNGDLHGGAYATELGARRVGGMARALCQPRRASSELFLASATLPC
jgi:hypothetical protein